LTGVIFVAPTAIAGSSSVLAFSCLSTHGANITSDAASTALAAAAKRHGATYAQISVAWLIHHSPVMLAIPGTSTVKHLEENLATARLQLSNDEWTEVEKGRPAAA
jgi:aryl-alcohol dehydrogenase-like predicted oxidoreductase